jgi:choline transport protein
MADIHLKDTGTRHIEMEDLEHKKIGLNANNDDDRLAQLGHVQELRREYSIWALGSLCLCLMATWEALATVIATALTTGGAPCLFFNL